MESLRGRLLIAAPALNDSNFFRTVVLMLEHSDGGALGVTLNRPGAKTIGEVWTQLCERECTMPQLIGVGGPVAGPLVALHQRADLSEREVLPGVYVATHRDALLRLVDEGAEPLRMFSGYSGWGEGQLESELAQGAWLHCEAASDDVFCSDDELWKAVTRRIAEDNVFSRLEIRNRPTDPRTN